MDLWFTLRIGDTRLPVYLLMAPGDSAEPMIFMGPIARLPTETTDEWDPPSPAVGRLSEISKSELGSPLFGARCILNDECEADKECRGDAHTYLRSGELHSLCKDHTRPDDLLLELVDIRTKLIGVKETAIMRHERIRELHRQKLSSRQIARELGISQGDVAYHLSRQEQEHNLAKKAE